MKSPPLWKQNTLEIGETAVPEEIEEVRIREVDSPRPILFPGSF
jgi:hypothetical protein